MRYIRYFAGVSGLALAACGGSSDPEPVLPAGPPEYRALSIEALDLIDKLNARIEIPEFLGEPPIGDATFEGVVVIYDDANPNFGGYLGDFSATYTFATETFDGETGNIFFDGNTDPSVASVGRIAPGSIMIDGTGVVAGQFDFDIDGTLDGQPVSGTGTGAFVGPDGDMVVGESVDTAIGFTTDLTLGIVAD